MPTQSDSQPIFERIIAEVRSRAESGKANYGTYLQPHNGRNAMQDLKEELLDAAHYAEQHINEVADLKAEVDRLRTLLAEAEAREAGPNKGHKWEIKPSVLPYPVCRVCGVVQRKDDQNSPCKGLTAIGLREASSPTAISRLTVNAGGDGPVVIGGSPSAAEVIAAAEKHFRYILDVAQTTKAMENEAALAIAAIAKWKEAQR